MFFAKDGFLKGGYRDFLKVLADVRLYRNYLQMSFPAVQPWQNKSLTFDSPGPGPQNWNEGTFGKTALLQNRPFP